MIRSIVDIALILILIGFLLEIIAIVLSRRRQEQEEDRAS